jgi:hypothetical protein
VTDFPAINEVIRAAFTSRPVPHAQVLEACDELERLQKEAAHYESLVQYWRSKAEDGRLRAAVNRYLDNDGSRGCYDALALADARRELDAALESGTQSPESGAVGVAPNPGSVGSVGEEGGRPNG